MYEINEGTFNWTSHHDRIHCMHDIRKTITCMSSGQLSSRLPPTPTSRYASAWSNALKARLPVQLGGWSGLKPQNDLPKRVKTKPLLEDPNSGCFIIFILQQALCLERIKENLYWRRPTTVPPQNSSLVLVNTSAHYIHTWTHTDIQNPFFSWQKALAEARVGPWTRLWFSKVWLTICSLLLMPSFFPLSHPEESHCLIPILWQV